MRFSLLWTVCLIIGGTAVSVVAEGTVLATTDLGPVTTEDLEFEIFHPLGSLPEGDLSPREWPYLETLLRQAAYHQMLEHLGETEGITTTPEFQAWLESNDEEALAHHARFALIDFQVQLPREELLAYVDEHRESMRLPAVASWRFMHFGVAPDASAAERERALERAGEAQAAVLAGEEFAVVAARLASPPVSGAPGRVIGPVEFEGRIVPAIEEPLRSLPLGEVSEPLDTPAGPVLIQVESRELERYPDEGNIIFALGSQLREQRRAERERQVFEDLRTRYPVEIPDQIAATDPPETVALRVGPRTVTLADLQRRALLTEDPEMELAWWLTTMGRAELVERELLLAEMETTGIDASADLFTTAEANLRMHIWEEIEGALDTRRRPSPTWEEMQAHFEANPDRFTRELLTVEALWLGHRTLARLTSSEYGLDHHRMAQSLRDRWAQGEALERLTGEIGIEEVPDSGAVAWSRVLREELPSSVADLLPGLAPGEVSPVHRGPSGMLILRMVEAIQDTPRLEQVARDVRRSIIEAQGPMPALQDELLERYHYQQLVEVSRLRWDEEGHLTVSPASGEEVAPVVP